MSVTQNGIMVVIPVFGRDDVLATVPRLLAWHPGLRIDVVDNGNALERAAKIAALSGMVPRSEGASGAMGSGRVEVVRLAENRGGSGGANRRACAEKKVGEWLAGVDDLYRTCEDILRLYKAHDF